MPNSITTAGWHLRAVIRLAMALFISVATPTILLGQVRLASRFGEANVGGQRVIVHVTVAVPQGADANALADDAVRGQGARPFRPSEFSVTGLIWDQFLDGIPGNDVVNQYYNPSGEPTAFSAISSLQSSQRTWTGVATSLFSFDDAGPTSRCPSLVKECPGAQVFDGFNDVGWMNIGGCCTLAVTWSGTSTDEADMALNSRFSWTNTGGDFDVETVMLHENGHVVGLGHSSVSGSVMEAVYAGQRRVLTIDDERGATYLYPVAGAIGVISGTVTSGGNPVRRARVRISDLPISATTDDFGNYVLEKVPNIGEYSVTASAGGYDSQTLSNVHVGDEVDFALQGKGGS
jgi:hypothetical protein